MNYKKLFLYIIIALFLLFFDGQLGQFITRLLPQHFVIVSHLLLLFLLSLFMKGEKVGFILTIFLSLALFADIYYLNFIGIYLLTMLAIIAILSLIDSVFLENIVYRCLLFFLICFAYDFISYLLAWLFGLTRQPLATFITYSLAPSMIFNLLLFVIILVLKRLPKISR